MAQTSKRLRVVLTVSGAVVAILSFLAHDLYREYVGQLRDSVSAAEATYRLREIDIRAQAIKKDQNHNLTVLQLSIDPGAPASDNSLEHRRHAYAEKKAVVDNELLSETKDKLTIEMGTSNDLVALLTPLHASWQDIAKAAGIRSRLQQVVDDINQIQAVDSHLNPDLPSPTRVQLIHQMKRDTAQLDSTIKDTADLADRAIDRAHKDEDQDQHYYNMATWFYGVFFILGWGLSLVGSVLDVESKA